MQKPANMAKFQKLVESCMHERHVNGLLSKMRSIRECIFAFSIIWGAQKNISEISNSVLLHSTNKKVNSGIDQ